MVLRTLPQRSGAQEASSPIVVIELSLPTFAVAALVKLPEERERLNEGAAVSVG